MSFRYLKWALSLKTKTSSQKLILIELANMANDEGISFPSINIITKHTHLSKRTIVACVKELKKESLLITHRRFNKSNIYQLLIENGTVYKDPEEFTPFISNEKAPEKSPTNVINFEDHTNEDDNETILEGQPEHHGMSPIKDVINKDLHYQNDTIPPKDDFHKRLKNNQQVQQERRGSARSGHYPITYTKNKKILKRSSKSEIEQISRRLFFYFIFIFKFKNKIKRLTSKKTNALQACLRAGNTESDIMHAMRIISPHETTTGLQSYKNQQDLYYICNNVQNILNQQKSLLLIDELKTETTTQEKEQDMTIHPHTFIEELRINQKAIYKRARKENEEAKIKRLKDKHNSYKCTKNNQSSPYLKKIDERGMKALKDLINF